MLTAIIFILCFYLISFIYGWGLLSLFGRILRIEQGELLSFPWILIAGMAALTTLGVIISLFMPLSAAAFGILAAGAVAIAAVQKKKLRSSVRIQLTTIPVIVWILGGILLVTVAHSSTLIPHNPDTGLYHAQTIRWAEQFATVPGLGNFNGRFAFNSSWLELNALFSLAFLGIQSFHLIPAAFFLAVMLVGLEAASKWLRGQPDAVNILKALLIPTAFYVMGGEISSPGTDLPVVLIVWLLAAGWLERFKLQGAKRMLFDLVLFVLALLAATVKLSAVPVMLYGGLIFVSSYKNRQMILLMIGLATLILLPWMARSVILSGYPLFPVPGVPGFNIDWRIPAVDVAEEQRSILAFGRDPHMDPEVVLKLPLLTWLKAWFFSLTINRKMVLLLSAVSPLLIALVWALIARRRSKTRSSTVAIGEIAAVNLVGAAYWLFTAPDFRFGLGYLIILGLLPLIFAASTLEIRKIIPGLVILATIVYLLFFTAASFESKDFVKRMVIPEDYPMLPTEPCGISNGTVLCPAEISFSHCWYEPFPCAPFPRPNVEFRGDSLQDGFRKAP